MAKITVTIDTDEVEQLCSDIREACSIIASMHAGEDYDDDYYAQRIGTTLIKKLMEITKQE